MAPHSKPSAASATDSDPNVFFWARLKLTAVYVLILAVILIGFSAVLYQNFAQNLAEGGDSDFAGPGPQRHFISQTLASVENEILLTDLIIIAIAAGVSYALAGYTLRPIQKSLEAQRSFSEHASHELRTPLAVMKNDMEVLSRNHNPTKEQVRLTLQNSIEEVDRLSSMVTDLLALARSQNHSRPLKEKVDITAIAKNISEKMRSIATDKYISLFVQGDAPLMVQGSAAAFERVLTNLLQNAIEHTKAGTITIKTRQDSSNAVLTVSDTGSGIDEKDLPHVFERFYKAEGEPGSGLGLSIVKALIAEHGGSVEAASTKGTGTTITIRLPLA
jgi:signal transduction histidine kinase